MLTQSSTEFDERSGQTRESGKLVRHQLLICISLLYTTVLLSPLAVPFGGKQLPISWMTGLLHFVALAVVTRASVDLYRLLAWGVAFFVILLETATVHPEFSSTSLLYIAGIYLPLVLTTTAVDSTAVRVIWKHLSILAGIITICGLIQIAVQVVMHGYFLDPLRLLPASVLLQGYNTTYPIAYGEWLQKPNGMFLLEPSFFSQMIAFGLLGEFVFFRRKWLIVLFSVGLVSSFSGTGLVMLLPAMLFVGSFRVVMGFLGLAFIASCAIFVLGYGDIFLTRATETGEQGSSGNQRFVAPYQEMWSSWQEKDSTCLFGKGAGVAERMSLTDDANFSAIPKVGVEYGLIGLAFFAVFWAAMFGNLAMPRALVVALMIFYFAGSGSFLQPFSVFTIWALTVGFLRRPQSHSSLVEHTYFAPAEA